MVRQGKSRPLFSSVPVSFAVPAFLALMLVAGPLLGLLLNVPWQNLGQVLADPTAKEAGRLSLLTSLSAAFICGIFGIPLSLVLTKVLERSPARKLGTLLYALIYTPLILSPVVSGLALTFFWGRRGIVGSWLHETGLSIPFTPYAVVLAQVFVGLPFFVATAVTTLRAIPHEYEEIARVEGAKPGEITFKVLLPLAAPGIITAFLLAFARSLGEYGATITFAGNMAGKTRTIPLNIELLLSSNSMAEALGAALMLLSLYLIIGGIGALLIIVQRLRKVSH